MDFSKDKFENRTPDQQKDYETTLAVKRNSPSQRLQEFNRLINEACQYGADRLRVDFNNAEIRLMYWFQLYNAEAVKAFSKRVEDGNDFISYQDWEDAAVMMTHVIDQINEQPIPVGGVPFTAVDYLSTDADFRQAIQEEYVAWLAVHHPDLAETMEQPDHEAYSKHLADIFGERCPDVSDLMSDDSIKDMAFAELTDPEHPNVPALRERQALLVDLTDLLWKHAATREQELHRPKERVYNIDKALSQLQVTVRQNDRDLGYFTDLHDGAWVVQQSVNLDEDLRGKLFMFEIPNWYGEVAKGNSWVFVAASFTGWVASIATPTGPGNCPFVPAVLSPNWADVQKKKPDTHGTLVDFETIFSEVVLAKLPVKSLIMLMEDVARLAPSVPDDDYWASTPEVELWREMSSMISEAVNVVVGLDNHEGAVIPRGDDPRFYEPETDGKL